MTTAQERHDSETCEPQFCPHCREDLHPADCGCSDCVLEREERAIDAREQSDLDDYMEGGW